MQLHVDLVTDLHAGRAKQLLTQAEGQHTSTCRHRVRVEIDPVELATNLHLLQAAEAGCHRSGDVDDRQTRFQLRPKVADDASKARWSSHSN